MYNWSVDTARLKKDVKRFNIFRIEQAINFGLNGTKLSLKNIKENFNLLKIDSNKKTYLLSLIWQK